VKIERQVARRFVVDLRRTRRQRRLRIGDSGKLVDIEHDGFGPILGLRSGFSHDDGHGFADEAHLALGQ
jgi:hypothetical protein